MEKTCCKCGKKGPHTCYELKKNLKEKGFPTSSKKYKEAHEKATKMEKEKFPSKDFKRLEKMDRKAGSKHTLIGKNTKTGKIEVSKKVPKDLREEVAYHEKVENKELRKKK